MLKIWWIISTYSHDSYLIIWNPNQPIHSRIAFKLLIPSYDSQQTAQKFQTSVNNGVVEKKATIHCPSNYYQFVAAKQFDPHQLNCILAISKLKEFRVEFKTSKNHLSDDFRPTEASNWTQQPAEKVIWNQNQTIISIELHD